MHLENPPWQVLCNAVRPRLPPPLIMLKVIKSLSQSLLSTTYRCKGTTYLGTPVNRNYQSILQLWTQHNLHVPDEKARGVFSLSPWRPSHRGALMSPLLSRPLLGRSWNPWPFCGAQPLSATLVAFNNEQGSKCPAGQCMQEAMQWQQRGRAPSILFFIFKLVLLIFLSMFSSQHSCLFFFFSFFLAFL